MNLKNANDILDVYEGLRDRALKIVEGAPYWKYVPDDWAIFSIVGDEGVLRWPESSISYGDLITETESVAFPARLLFLSEKEFTAWKADELAAYEKIRSERARAIHAEKLAASRAEYERLRAEFEPVRVYDKKPASS